MGHLRDVRRLIVAMSRARLGLYVFCRRSLFEQCYELQPTFQLLLQRPDHLGLNLHEMAPTTDRLVGETGPVHLVKNTHEMTGIVNFRMHQLDKVLFFLCKFLNVIHFCLYLNALFMPDGFGSGCVNS